MLEMVKLDGISGSFIEPCQARLYLQKLFASFEIILDKIRHKRIEMKNIEDFNKITTALFAELYASFPKNIVSFSSEDLCAKIKVDGCVDTCKASVEFLEYEGFVRYKSSTGYGHFSHLNLTLKGLSLLQKTPKTVDEREESLGEAIVNGVKRGSWNIATQLATTAMQGALGE